MILKYITILIKYLFWFQLVYLNLYAQIKPNYLHTLSLQIGEPWSIRFQRPFLKNSNFQIGAGVGMLGLIKQPDYSEKFSLENGYRYYGRTDIFTLDIYIRRYLQFSKQNTCGLFLDLGIHNRCTPEMGFKLKSNTQMYIPNFFFWEPIPYFQLGSFIRLGSRKQFELNIQYGLGVNVLFVTGYIEQMGGIGLGYRFLGATGRRSKDE